MNLLQQEVLEAALLGRDRVPLHDLRLALDRVAVEGGDGDGGGRELGDLAILVALLAVTSRSGSLSDSTTMA